jgi:hypothetical protein
MQPLGLKRKGSLLTLEDRKPWKEEYNRYNDVNNQQDATTFSFINLFKSALNVSGDKFAHPQEHF